MRLRGILGLALLGLSTSALGAIVVQQGNTCSVTPGSAAPARRAKRGTPARDTTYDRFEELYRASEAAAKATPSPIPDRRESYPRPEPGSAEALHWERNPVVNDHLDREVNPFLEDDEAAQHDQDEAQAEELVVSQRHTAVAAAAADDTPALLEAFKKCGHDGTVIIQEGTYNIRQVMNTTDFRNVDIHIYGKLVWPADNIQYWLRASFPVVYAGRSTAWLVGGTNISIQGHGKALFDGNGQTWIDQNRDQGNQNGRPISLTVWRAKDVYIDGITWRMAQFWHTFVAYSQNVTMTNLDMDTFSTSQYKAVNTDGTDTWNSRDVTISNWTVRCGDVSVTEHSFSGRDRGVVS